MSDTHVAARQSEGSDGPTGTQRNLCFILEIVLRWNNPVCCRDGGFAFQKQFSELKKSPH